MFVKYMNNLSLKFIYIFLLYFIISISLYLKYNSVLNYILKFNFYTIIYYNLSIQINFLKN